MSDKARLIEVARDQLATCGSMDEAALARRVYGAVGPVEPWVRLLHGMLAGHDRFERSPEGRWSLRQHNSPQGALLVAGRGTRARGGRLLALALAPLQTLRPVWKWHFLTESRAPAYVRSSVSMDEEAQRHATPFTEVAPEIDSILRDRELVLLDSQIGSLLSTELQLAGLPRLSNPVRLPGQEIWRHAGGKRSLAEVRAELGLIPDVEDELVGELQVLQRLCSVTATPATIRPSGSIHHKERLRERASRFPEGPGVYQFLGDSGQPLYIGSAVNLRRRALTYFGGQIEISRGLRGLLEAARQVEHIGFGTHLEAVLEEAALIERLQPVYNVQRSVAAQAAWLRIGVEAPMNVVQVAAAPRPDSALYLGPLPNHTAVQAAASTLAALWGFRRRGGKKQVDPASLARIEALRGLLADPEAFCAEMRRRYHLGNGALSTRQRSELWAQLERTERAALDGELRPAAPGAGDALVIRYHPESGDLYLLLVREHACLACARVDGRGDAAVRRCAMALMNIEARPDGAAPESSALVSRWLQAHRRDPFVVSLQGGAGDVMRALQDAITSAEVKEEVEIVDVEVPWWLEDEPMFPQKE